MKIEVWSDFVCPFCYIGKRNLEEALERAGIKDEVEVEYKSFQLNPDAKKSYDISLNEIIASKYGITVEQADQSNQNIINAAKNVGLEYNFEDIKPTNTFDAHRLSHYAKTKGKMDAYTEVMMRNYFVEAMNISEEDVLLNAVEEVGLDREDAKLILASNEYAQDISFDVQESKNFGISGVPFFIFDRKTALSGAQAVEAFIEAFKKVGE